jgi:zinc transporter ZupT
MTDLAPRPRNRVGILALVLALVAAAAPLVAWIVVAIVGAIESNSVDDAIYGGGAGSLGLFWLPVVLAEVVPGWS